MHRLDAWLENHKYRAVTINNGDGYGWNIELTDEQGKRVECWENLNIPHELAQEYGEANVTMDMLREYYELTDEWCYAGIEKYVGFEKTIEAALNQWEKVYGKD